MREAITQKLYTYWNDIRAGRLAPKRFEIEPSQIASMLPDTFI
ncbi:MAG: PAS domain-containing protein, partial [Hyphomicrobium sp.]